MQQVSVSHARRFHPIGDGRRASGPHHHPSVHPRPAQRMNLPDPLAEGKGADAGRPDISSATASDGHAEGLGVPDGLDLLTSASLRNTSSQRRRGGKDARLAGRDFQKQINLHVLDHLISGSRHADNCRIIVAFSFNR